MGDAAGALHRRLGPVDAVALGLGGMIGTGVFVVSGPVTAVAGRGVLGCLVVAATVAACNATSAARLASRYPVSGGAYHWGRELLHPVVGSVAGWCFVVGKIASAGAAALTVGLYVAALTGSGPNVTGAVATATVIAVTAANMSGIRRTALVSRVLVTGVLLVLVVGCVAALLTAPAPAPAPAWMEYLPASGGMPDWLGVGAGAGLFFLAFAGYARIATLGEEVREPRRTIPAAVAIAFGVSLVVYVLVVVTAVRVLGYGPLADTRTPLADIARAAPSASIALPVVSLAAVAAATAVALGVQAGISRVLLAMARTGEVPAALSRVDSGRGSPWVADLLVGIVVLAVVIFGGVVGAIALSAGTVLVYYAVANAAALRLPGRVGRVVAGAGVGGCCVLAGSLLWWAAT